ncbi:phenylalanine--tRNA ligase subunit beta [Methylophilaceae bacterium]|jgi:phenylalanyl-tRNA synthetase beta chain|nr:phenylalanine--tRNA ligase subunit beta [Methylophilaceae bacterium]
MQFSKAWLQEFFDKSIDDVNLEEVLTMSGLEVDDVQDLSKISKLVVVGEIVSIEKHPDADRLNVCQVNTGLEKPIQIVCGAPNARVGIKVPCALVGAKLPGFEIKKAKLRGVESNGMLCSANEIGISQDSKGLYEIGLDKKVGELIIDALELNDVVYTLSLTPNRADCLSILGIAREVSALLGLPLKDINHQLAKESFTLDQKVKIYEEDDCPKYCGIQIKNINNKITLPVWIEQKLERSGIGSINAVVDIANFVLIETGQPLHTFDQAKISGEISVRKANKNESLHLLNDQKIKLEGSELIIADEQKALALAGIMGGEFSSTNTETTEIFIESAYFDPTKIAGRARSFGLNTDSSHRFERGVDFRSTSSALQRAAVLIVEFCGGECSNILDIESNLPKREPIKLRTKKVSDIMGLALKDNDIKSVLDKLNLIYSQNKDHFLITPPSFRFDLSIEEDLVEEIIRIYGYNNIPALTPTSQDRMIGSPNNKKSIYSVKSSLVNLGYNEVVSYSFIDKDIEEKLHSNLNIIQLQNPIASQMNVMRSKLWGSHIDTLSYNLNRGQSNIRIFEIAPVYQKIKSGFKETLMLSGLVYGDSIPEQWNNNRREVNFYDIKGDIEIISSNTLSIEVPKNIVPEIFHPGQAAELIMNQASVGWLGQLHPEWQQKYELIGKTYLFELSMESLINIKDLKITLPSKFPPLRRDISVLVDKDIRVGDIVNEVNAQVIDGLIDFYPFDLYEGKGIEESKKSIAFLILMQDTYKTLEDENISNIVNQVIKILKNKFNASLR